MKAAPVDPLALAVAGLAAVCNAHGCRPEAVVELRVYPCGGVLGFMAAADVTLTAFQSDMPEPTS